MTTHQEQQSRGTGSIFPDVIQEMAAGCCFRRDFVRLSVKICRFSSTLTGTASKYYLFCSSFKKVKVIPENTVKT